VRRFGSALDLNPHLHLLALDGVFVAPPGDSDDPLRFLKLGAPDVAEARSIGWTTYPKRAALLREQGRWVDADAGDGDAADALALDEPLLHGSYGAALQGVSALGPNRIRRVLRLVERVPPQSERPPGTRAA